MVLSVTTAEAGSIARAKLAVTFVVRPTPVDDGAGLVVETLGGWVSAVLKVQVFGAAMLMPEVFRADTETV